MYAMFCWNRVEDFSRWKKVFTSHASAHADAGLHLVELWSDVDDASKVFFLFKVDSIEKARAFLADPVSAEAGKEAGVIEGDFHFLERCEAY